MRTYNVRAPQGLRRSGPLRPEVDLATWLNLVRERRSRYHWRRICVAPLQRFLRAQLGSRCLASPGDIRFLEDALRKGRVDGVFRLAPRLEGLQRALLRLEPAEYRRAVAKAHRAVLRAASAPVLRTYDFAGFAVTHDIRNLAEWHAFVDGVYQPGIGALMAHFSDENSGVADIGANVGIFTLPLARHVRKGQVYAFEPNPTSCRVLSEAVRANGLLSRATVERVALGATEGEAAFFVPADNAGAAGLQGTGRARCGHTLRVNVSTFDSWWAGVGEPSISVVKIDVEGHEPEVLQGMAGALDALRPVVILEVSPDVFDPAPLFAQLKGIGYELYQVEEHYPFYSRLDRRCLRKQFNLLAVPRHRLSELPQV